jgi:deoxyribose-phosphate aldolase
MKITKDDIRGMLDVAILSPTATAAEVEALAKTVVDERFGFFCINSLHVKRASELLKGSGSKVVACVGFPHGTVKTALKVAETEQCIGEGTQEIDMVLAIGALKGDDRKTAEEDVRAVVKAAAGAPVKVIIETPLLTYAQKIEASKLVQDAGAAFVKTCSGTTPDPLALYEDIRLIRQTVGPKMGIKASGRVGNYFRFTSMLEAGATRVGLVLEQAREILQGWDEANR